MRTSYPIFCLSDFLAGKCGNIIAEPKEEHNHVSMQLGNQVGVICIHRVKRWKRAKKTKRIPRMLKNTKEAETINFSSYAYVPRHPHAVSESSQPCI